MAKIRKVSFESQVRVAKDKRSGMSTPLKVTPGKIISFISELILEIELLGNHTSQALICMGSVGLLPDA